MTKIDCILAASANVKTAHGGAGGESAPAFPLRGGYPGPDEVEAFRRAPGFGEAALHAAGCVAEQYRGNWALNRLLGDRGRTLMGLAILDLHYNGGKDGGLTATRLKERCSEFGICSPGRVTAMLGALRLFGFLVEVHGGDRRVRRMRPTEKFLAVHGARRRCFLEALAGMVPEGRFALERQDDPAFAAAHVGALARMYAAGVRIVDYVPELADAFQRDAGMLILMALTVEARRGGGDPLAPLDMTISELARRYSVSRGHVLSVLRAAERNGLAVRPAGRGGGIRVTGALIDAVDRFVATVLLLHVVAVREARAALG